MNNEFNLLSEKCETLLYILLNKRKQSNVPIVALGIQDFENCREYVEKLSKYGYVDILKEYSDSFALILTADALDYDEIKVSYKNEKNGAQDKFSNTNIHITGDNHAPISVAGRDNNFTSISTINNIKEIKDKITEIKKELEVAEIDDDTKATIIDDLDVIEEQVSAEAPKTTRINKAIESLKNILPKIETFTAITANIVTIFPYVELYLKSRGLI